jgi:hypothetical protein
MNRETGALLPIARYVVHLTVVSTPILHSLPSVVKTQEPMRVQTFASELRRSSRPSRPRRARVQANLEIKPSLRLFRAGAVRSQERNSRPAYIVHGGPLRYDDLVAPDGATTETLEPKMKDMMVRLSTQVT